MDYSLWYYYHLHIHACCVSLSWWGDRRTNVPDLNPKEEETLSALTLAACRSFCSQWLQRCPPPQLGWGTQRHSSTSSVRTRSRTPRPSWGTAAHPPDTSRRRQPGSRSGEYQQWWSTPTKGEGHVKILDTKVKWCSEGWFGINLIRCFPDVTQNDWLLPSPTILPSFIFGAQWHEHNLARF